VIEVASRINHIVFDKTGTITLQNKNSTRYEGEALSTKDSNLVYHLTTHSTHPLSMAVHDFVYKDVPLITKYYKEVHGLGIEAQIDHHYVKLGSASFVNHDELNVNGSEVHLSIDNIYKGKFIINNVYREKLSEVVSNLQDLDYPMSILSGDNDKEKMALQSIFPKTTSYFFLQSPHDKLAQIFTLQAHKNVAMIGDGINDAGALKQSNLGIVVSDAGNQFVPSCEVIINADKFNNLSRYFDLSRRIKYLVWGAYFIAFLYNIIGLSYAVAGRLTPLEAAILMPLSSVTIVFYSILSSSLIVKYLFKEKDTYSAYNPQMKVAID
jgi:P-type Cu+ transporter